MFQCDPVMDPAWVPKRFLVDREIRHIGNQLFLIDAGDYDRDGKSEVIFWPSGYNEDGYTLSYYDFDDRVDFYRKYHLPMKHWNSSLNDQALKNEISSCTCQINFFQGLAPKPAKTR